MHFKGWDFMVYELFLNRIVLKKLTFSTYGELSCINKKETLTGLWINLEGWDGEGEGREAQKGGDIYYIYIYTAMADSCCLTENGKII